MINILIKIKDINWQRLRERWLYKKFASLKTSIVFLGFLVCFYILGTIFPQGEQLDEYIKAGGRFTSFVIFFDLLNIFNTPGFLISALFLFINLAVCAFERFLILWSHRIVVSGDIPFTPMFILPVDINPQWESTDESVRDIFNKELGFQERRVSMERKFPTRIMEKGLSYRWLTWMYHLGILFCFFGFFATYLFSFEDEITLYPKEKSMVKPSTTSRWNKSWGNGPQEMGFHIMLDEFITEYNQVPALDYPGDKLSRLAIALGWRDPRYTLKNESYFPKDWKSKLSIIKGNKKVLEKAIEVNDPLSYQGITFYQAAYKQNLKIQVDDNPIFLETETGKELIAPGIEGMLRFGTIRTGTLFKKDGSPEKIKPFVEVSLIKKDISGKQETVLLGKLEQDARLYIDNNRISLKEFTEASILSYRYDPGVPILWWAGIFVLLTMSLRVFGAWYRITYRVEEKEGSIPHVILAVKTRGLLSDEERLIKRLNYHVSTTAEPIDLDIPV